MALPKVKFAEITRSDVPFWHPKAEPVSEPKGSQWDDALRVLSGSADAAIMVTETNTRRRNQLKATLQTIAKNRGLHVKVRTQNALIYAWRTDEPGRFPAPEVSN